MCRTARIPSPVCGTCLFLFCRQINPSIHIGYGVQRRGGTLGTAQTIIGQISVTCGKIIGYAKQHQPGHIMLADVVAEVHISFAALGFHRGNGGVQLVLVVPHVLHGHRVVGAQQPNAAILCAVHAG